MFYEVLARESEGLFLLVSRGLSDLVTKIKGCKVALRTMAFH